MPLYPAPNWAPTFGSSGGACSRLLLALRQPDWIAVDPTSVPVVKNGICATPWRPRAQPPHDLPHPQAPCPKFRTGDTRTHRRVWASRMSSGSPKKAAKLCNPPQPMSAHSEVDGTGAKACKCEQWDKHSTITHKLQAPPHPPSPQNPLMNLINRAGHTEGPLDRHGTGFWSHDMDPTSLYQTLSRARQVRIGAEEGGEFGPGAEGFEGGGGDPPSCQQHSQTYLAPKEPKILLQNKSPYLVDRSPVNKRHSAR